MEKERTHPSRNGERPAQVVKREGNSYALYANGELWVMGRYGYMAGYVMNPEDIEGAIDAHEEDMAALVAEANAEFRSNS